MFSPYYALARRRGRGDPRHHCALNVVLYGRNGKRWAMTERGRGALHRTGTTLAIGPSALRWDGTTLTVDVDEVTAPLPSRIKGRVRVHPPGFTDYAVDLDTGGAHRWWPMAPCARVEVELDRPGLRWSGPGYLDTNSGDGPLETGFTTWNWSRAHLRDGTAAILYEAHQRDGGAKLVAVRCWPDGRVEEIAEPPPPAPLPRTRWRVGRGTRADAGKTVRVTQALEDAPFYSRSVLATHLLGEPAQAIHESLDLNRFAAPWVQLMLPFKMPRVRG